MGFQKSQQISFAVCVLFKVRHPQTELLKTAGKEFCTHKEIFHVRTKPYWSCAVGGRNGFSGVRNKYRYPFSLLYHGKKAECVR